MPFARINGVVAEVQDGGSDRQIESQGALTRGQAGRLVDSRRQARRTFTMRLGNLPHDEARSLALLSIGLAHVFSFNGGLHASTSLAPTTGHGAHLDPGAGWDGDAAVVRSGSSISFNAQLDDEWTVFLRFRDVMLTDSPWRYGCIAHDGREWLDGVEGVFGMRNLIAVSAAGVVTLNGRDLSNAASNLPCDELVILPWRLADAHVLDVLAWEQPWGPAPEVHLVGDAVESPLGIFAVGKAERGDVVSRGTGRTMRGALSPPRPDAPFAIDSDFLNNAMAEEVELRETDRPASLESLPLPTLYVPHGSAFVSGLVVRERIGGLDLADPLGASPFAVGPDGRPGSATVYAGTSDDRAFRVGAEGSAVGAAARLTVAGWVRPTALMLQTLWSRWTEAGVNREWRVRDDGTGRVVVELSDGGGANREVYSTNQPVLSAGLWSFVSFDYDAARVALGRVRMFVDGRPVYLDAAAVGAFTGMTSSGGTLHVPGQRTPATGLSGQIAQWACWSTALSTAQQRIAYLLTRRGHPLRRA